MVYDDYESTLIYKFRDDVKNGVYLDSNIDLIGRKAEDKYNNYISEVSDGSFKEYFISDFPNISELKVIDNCLETIDKIFKQTDVNNLFEEFCKNIEVNNSNDIFDGIMIHMFDDKNDIDIYLPSIPSIKNITSPTCMIHEFIHFLNFKFNVNFNKKMYYKEILSIFAELVASQTVNDNYNNNMSDYLEKVRLEAIDWHYRVHKEELDFMIKSIDKAKKNNDYSTLSLIFNTFPYFRDDMKNYTINFKKQLADSYGIGYLYGKYLYNRFIEDPVKFSNKLNEVIFDNKPIEDLFKYYDMSLRNRIVYEEVGDRVKQLKR